MLQSPLPLFITFYSLFLKYICPSAPGSPPESIAPAFTASASEVLPSAAGKYLVSAAGKEGKESPFKSENVLPKRFRLTKSEFNAVRRRGQLLSARLLAILILRQPYSLLPTPYSPKAGLIVSRRLSPKAVVRNRLKRRLRAALQRILPEIPANIHLVVLPNHRSLDASVEELESELRSLLTI